MRFIIYGNPVTKKNSQRIVTRGRFPKLLPSEQYVKYQRECLRQLSGLGAPMISIPVNVKALYYMQTRRKVDLSNLNSALHDILVDAGILEDDNRNIIAGHDGSRVFHDKVNPRVEVYITPMPRYEQWTGTTKKVRQLIGG